MDINQSLISLSFGKSNIVSTPETYFSVCRQLYDLLLTHSKLQPFPNLSEVKKTLIRLSLSNNYIKQVDLIYSVLFFQLKYLYLHHNWIHHLDLQMLIMPQLIYANLTSNLITQLAHPKVLALNRTSGIYPETCIHLEINNNPCGCPELSLALTGAIKETVIQWTGIANTEQLAWFGYCSLCCHGASGLQAVETILADSSPSGKTYLSLFCLQHLMNSVCELMAIYIYIYIHIHIKKWFF